MRSPNRLACGLSAAAAAWCFVAAGWMMTFPMMRGGRRPTVAAALAMIAVPALASLISSWAAWRGLRGLMYGMAAVVGLFAVVTGFSFGSAFLPAAGLLVFAVIASIEANPRAGDGGTAV